MAKRLKNLRVRRVDLVRQGASRDASDPDGPAARILLYKSADPPAPKPGEDTAAEPKCSECGEPLKEGARFCSQCGTKVEGEPTQKARSLPAGARRVEPVVEEPPKGATRAEWYAFLEARAGIAQLPLDKYLGTPEGSALYERYVSAPLMRDEPRSAPLVEPALDLTALREAAEAEEQADQRTREAYQKMLDRCEELFPWQPSVAKRLQMLSEREEFKPYYRAYAMDSRARSSKAREAFASALISDELEALARSSETTPPSRRAQMRERTC